MFYLPRGPILDFENTRLLEFYFSELKQIAKKRHCLFIKVDPGITYADYHYEEKDDVTAYPKAKAIIAELEKSGKVQRFKQRFSYDRTTSLSYDLS